MSSYFQEESGLSVDLAGSVPAQIRQKWKWLLVGAAAVLLFLLLNFLRGAYTDLLWFGELGFRAVYVKILLTRVVLFLAGFGIFGVLAGVSLYFAYRLSAGAEESPLPQASANFLRRLILWGTIAGGTGLSVVFGVFVAAEWELFLRFWNAVSFGDTDPVFNRDVSFYVFSLPLYEFVRGWLFNAAIVILIATGALYFVRFSFRGVGFEFTPSLKMHVSVIVAARCVTLAAGHWLDRWGLVLSDQGAVFGAAYTDINARSPALLILSVVAVAVAVLMLVNAYMRGVRLAAGGIALWLVMLVVLQVAWPRTMQRFTVNPNEFVKEREYIARNIDFTRRGYDLSGAVVRPYPVNPALSAELIAENLQTVDNIRLWDHGPILDVYRQIQQIRLYYDFEDADVDRYTVDGEYRQVMLAAREVAHEKLEDDAQTWVNTKLRFTHGFGVAMSPVTEFTSEGRPEFFAKDIPNDGVIRVQGSEDAEPDILIENPRIYFGEKTDSYVIVNTATAELDYQAAGSGEPESNRYDGNGGVRLGSVIRRLAYGWQFTDINIPITGAVTRDSRIQYRRDIQERVSTVAPFLQLDKDPYIVAAGGQLFWVQDAYTVSDRYPYSAPSPSGFNYIRNSVKVVVDAYNGDLTFYIVDTGDPIVRMYSAVFPELFTSLDDMPHDLREHLRYPQDLFGIQASIYLRYHMLDPLDFYNLEDIWSIPDEKFGQSGELRPVAPYYVIMKIPGEEQEEFVLLIPYTRNEPPILAGWLAARNDGENYGELVAFDFPKERQVDSPQQIEAKIDNDPTISEWFTLRCQEGSDCIRGNLLVIPVASGDEFGLLYAEPIYLRAEGFDFPELKKVILATGDRVVMEDSVPEAIAALTGYLAPAGTPDDVSETPPPTTKVSDARMGEEIDRLSEAIEAIRKELSNLEESLQRLSDLAGGE